MKDHFVTAKQSAQQNKPFFAAWINTFVSLACLQDSADFSPIDKMQKTSTNFIGSQIIGCQHKTFVATHIHCKISPEVKQKVLLSDETNEGSRF